MYRALAYLALQTRTDVDNGAALAHLAATHSMAVDIDESAPLGFRIVVDGAELTEAMLQGNDVTAIVSTVAAHAEVRAADGCARNGASLSAVRSSWPDAISEPSCCPTPPVKIFLTASVAARVERRRAQLERAGVDVDVRHLRQEIEERDRLDRTRAVSPLEPAPDAHTIDSSDLPIERVVDDICAIVARVGGRHAMNPRLYDLAAFALRVVFVTVFRARGYGMENVPRRRSADRRLQPPSRTSIRPRSAFCPRRISFMAKKELFEIPVLGPAIAAVGAYPVDRQGSARAAIKRSLAVLEGGGAVGIFPEGTRNLAGDVVPQTGVALLASLSGAPVLPACVVGGDRASKLGQMKVAFGAPLALAAGRKATRDDLAKFTRRNHERDPSARGEYRWKFVKRRSKGSASAWPLP